MYQAYTVISFGNYETKILICTIIDNLLFPIYKKSFITKNSLQDSYILDEHLLSSTLNEEFKKIPLEIFKTNLILNIPLKNVEIWQEKGSINDFVENKKDVKKQIFNKTLLKKNDLYYDVFELEKKFVYFSKKNQNKNIKELNQLENIKWKINFYLTNKKNVSPFIEILKDFRLKPSLVTCDSLVMNNLFKNKERKNKVLINIGHLKSTIDRYENEVLINQKSIDFGIRHLTSEISKKAQVDGQEAIKILKVYKDIANIDEKIPLVNQYKEKYFHYTQITINDIDKLIKTWINDLISLVNSSLANIDNDNFGIDEIYFYSSMDILDTLNSNIKKLLDSRTEFFFIKPEIFGIQEPKYCSLIASIYHYLDLKNNY